MTPKKTLTETPTPLTLIYCHGFLSSGMAQKAQILAQFIARKQLPIELLTPTLSNYPSEALDQITELINAYSHQKLALIGSSLGGFYATHFTQTMSIASVVINPAIKPHQLIKHYLGDNINPHTQTPFHLTASHIDILEKHYHPRIDHPDKLLVLVQTADEVLDAEEGARHYQPCQRVIMPGGDHHFQNFVYFLPLITDWLMANS